MKNSGLMSLLFLILISGCVTENNPSVNSIQKYELSVTDSLEIARTLMLTEEAWNNNDLEGFMEGYINSEKLVFVGSRGPTYGYNSTLESYKKGYPDAETMGSLSFEIIDLYQIDMVTAIMIGKFYLARTVGDMQGYYTLVWQKIDEKWLIISDHSSGEDIVE